MSSDKPAYLVRAGRHGEDEELALKTGQVVIGFTKVPSLQRATDRQTIMEIVDKTYPDGSRQSRANYTGQLTTFALGMQEGDLVVLPRKLTSQVALGRVAGSYQYSDERHTRPVKWERTDVPRHTFRQDLLHSFGAYLTVCSLSRNDAARRIEAVLRGDADPGLRPKPQEQALAPSTEDDAEPDLTQMANDQVVARIQERFSGHRMTDLVAAVLRAEGWLVSVSQPGPDGGADILAARGSLGTAGPRLCVQVKSQQTPADVTVLRTLIGTMQSFNAEQALLVCWGGFNRVVQQQSKQQYFTVRLWESSDLVEAVYRNFDRLPAEIQAELPLKQVWVLVPDDQV